MKKLPLYQVDAFTDHLFSGNPAAICPLKKWLSDSTMQSIAAENNLAETAFFVKNKSGFHIRWFTPVTEVDLCGHATLAAAAVLFEEMALEGDEVQFDSKSGKLTVKKEDDQYSLNFPADKLNEVEIIPDGLVEGLGVQPEAVLEGRSDLIVVVKDELIVKELKPDFDELKKLPYRGVAVTAIGDNVDFVSRFFAPQSGIDEDPVTGSAHTSLTPHWAPLLNHKEVLHAQQLSKRGGELLCTLAGDRVIISGKARLYFKGNIFLED